MTRDRYYWNANRMDNTDLDDHFRLVSFDEIGFSEDAMDEDELEAEMQFYAYEHELTEAEAREYIMDRIADGDERDYAWEKYLQAEDIRG